MNGALNNGVSIFEVIISIGIILSIGLVSLHQIHLTKKIRLNKEVVRFTDTLKSTMQKSKETESRFKVIIDRFSYRIVNNFGKLYLEHRFENSITVEESSLPITVGVYPLGSIKPFKASFVISPYICKVRGSLRGQIRTTCN